MKIIVRSCCKQNLMDLAGSSLNVLPSKIILTSSLVGCIYCSGHIVLEMLSSSEIPVKKPSFNGFKQKFTKLHIMKDGLSSTYLSWVVNYII